MPEDNGEFPKLTQRQREVFAFIVNSIDVVGYPPTRVEIAEHFGWSGANCAHGHLVALQKKGYIEIAPRVSRGIKLVDGALEAVG